jgi:hypothetical protein
VADGTVYGRYWQISCIGNVNVTYNSCV